MSEKTIPEWGEIVHVNGMERVVVSEMTRFIYVADRHASQSCVEVDEIDEYKPRTITIGDMKVPEPVREPLKFGEEYWAVDLLGYRSKREIWEGLQTEYTWLNLRIIHLTKEAAERHLKALIRVSGGESV